MWNEYTVIFIHSKCSMRQTVLFYASLHILPIVVITNFEGADILYFIKPCRKVLIGELSR